MFMGFTPDDADFAIAVFQKINQYIANSHMGMKESLMLTVVVKR